MGRWLASMWYSGVCCPRRHSGRFWFLFCRFQGHQFQRLAENLDVQRSSSRGKGVPSTTRGWILCYASRVLSPPHAAREEARRDW